MTSKKKRTLTVFLSAMFYMLTVWVGVILLKLVPEDGVWRWLVAVVPLSGVAVLFAAAIWNALKGDELEQRSAAISGVAALVLFAGITIGWGILEAFVGVPAINPIWWGALSMGAWSGIHVLVWKHYQ